MNTDNMVLNMNEMEQVNGGAQIMQGGPELQGTPVPAIAKGAASGSGIRNGTYRPGGVMVAAVGGVMGALSALHDWMFGG